MTFKEAYNLMRRGEKVKRKHWSGFWKWNNISRTIEMHTKEGCIIDIRETKDVDYTFSNIISDDWEVATEANSALIRGEIYE